MISIIIPTLNEASHLPALLHYLKRVPFNQFITEIIVSDGNSTDNTMQVAEDFGIRSLKVNTSSRALQMNAAARIARGQILYFLHVDSFPPKDFANEIIRHVENGCSSGCFRMQFDHHHWFLKLNAWFTRFNIDLFRFGDQSLFISRDMFFSIGQFREDHLLLEDQEIINRIRKAGHFQVIPRYITTSARKYLHIGIYKLQAIYFYLNTLYQFGIDQPRLEKKYRQLIIKSIGR